MLITAYQPPSTATYIVPLQIIGGAPWMESDRYDIQATADCSGGPILREQLQLMVRSMLHS
jgi:uncharacterized protein (TIGR03435 family)